MTHEMYNDGDESLVCLAVGQRLALDVCDYLRQGISTAAS
ncbi:hypothetical protein SAMN05192555_10795 [Franzmannia pantelleriensis]|uniref:Uncharacterized protein n=1 Tax=Franzmannia pantelleriensis TaxID=48727 RepID=A0A1G9NBW1_9GAMM|nr:hypothetical protein SAMN05192555_10795 [Halomonas pantelleriensis]